MKEQKKGKKRVGAESAWLWKLVASMVIATLVVVHIGNAYGVSLLADEFGYWGPAAVLNGYDWSGTLSNFPYYSFIYSLILYPIMALPVEITTMFRIALVVNALMLVVIFGFPVLAPKESIPGCRKSSVRCFA